MSEARRPKAKKLFLNGAVLAAALVLGGCHYYQGGPHGGYRAGHNGGHGGYHKPPGSYGYHGGYRRGYGGRYWR